MMVTGAPRRTFDFQSEVHMKEKEIAELRRRFRGVHAAAGQHAGYQIGISRIHQTRTCGAVFRRNVPGGKFHDPPPPFASFYNKVQYTKFANKGKGKNQADHVAIRKYIPYNETEN